jgi:putative transposase
VSTAKHSPKETKPMALPQSAVSDLLEVLRTGDAVDLIRESVRTVLQELIEAEAGATAG